MHILKIILFFFIITNALSAQDKKNFEFEDYYPLAIGNKWVYDVVLFPHIGGPIYEIKEVVVLKDSIASNGKSYFVLDHGTYEVLERVDSVEGKVYRYDEYSNDEILIDDLLAEVGDTVYSHRYGNGYTIVTGITPPFSKWGLTVIRRSYRIYDGAYVYLAYSLIQNFGLDHHTWDLWFGSGIENLKGCIINGVVYGDTSLVSIEDMPIVANEFYLSQNYPNPFNPSTTIRYEIPEISFVTIKVYDILGNEITTLVNEEKSAGSYEVEFNSHSGEFRNLTSGIYIFRLKAGPFVETKKMILLK